MIFGVDGHVPLEVCLKSTKPHHIYQPLYGSDDFVYPETGNGKVQLKKFWQFNHNPQHDLWAIIRNKKALRIRTGKLSSNVTEAQNTLTQRTLEPMSGGQVTLDGSNMKNGDYAGIAALLGSYGILALSRSGNQYYLEMRAKDMKEEVFEQIPIKTPIVRIKCEVDFRDSKDRARFYYLEDQVWKKIGKIHKLAFKLDHFTGCRFGLFYYSTKTVGGECDFMNFVYEYTLD